MWQYVLKRILFFIPTLFVVSSILFIVKTQIPEDQISKVLEVNGIDNQGTASYLKEYSRYATQMGLDKPNFYFSIVPSHYPKELYKVIPKQERINLQKELKNKSLTLPRVAWHGNNNQYHHWLLNIFKGELSISYKDGRQVSTKIGQAFKWTITLLLFSIFLSFALGIPLGIWLATSSHHKIKKIISFLSFILFATPLFYLCTIAMIFFTTSEYGNWTNIFPSVDLGPSLYQGSFLNKFFSYSSHLLLPAICWTLHSLAYMSIQMKVSMQEQMTMQYVRTALSKGLSKSEVNKKHVLKNALLPIITMMVSAIPGALSGSIVIEYIFNIPGIGRLLVDSIYALDWNVVMGILLIVSIVTMLSYLLGDILYTLINPKIRFAKKT